MCILWQTMIWCDLPILMGTVCYSTAVSVSHNAFRQFHRLFSEQVYHILVFTHDWLHRVRRMSARASILCAVVSIWWGRLVPHIWKYWLLVPGQYSYTADKSHQLALLLGTLFINSTKNIMTSQDFKIFQCFENILLLHQWHLRFDQLIILCIKRAQGGAFAGASPSPVIFWIGWKTNGVLPRIQQ